MSKAFFAEFWNVMEDILLNKNTIKNVILQEKENKTKQTKKRHEKKKAKYICCGNSTPGWTYGKFYLHDINLTWPFSDIFSDGINARTWKVFLPPINIQSSYLNWFTFYNFGILNIVMLPVNYLLNADYPLKRQK